MLWCADVYARKGRLLAQWRHLLVPMVPVCLVVVCLVVGQGDLGTALVLFAIILGMLWIVGAPTRLFLGSFLALSVLAFALATTQQERVARLTSFLNPLADYSGNGWQASHGFFALATGGLWGSGIGASSQKWGNLPEAHTDYIFAIIGEEFGLFGTLVVLGLFVTLAYAGIRIASRTTEKFVRYAAAGIVVWLLGQALINIGMVLGLLPVIGIPLPLISYGGSALLPTLIALGLLLSFAKTEPGAAAALRARRRGARNGSRPARAPGARSAMRVLLAGGGTAGHTSPLLATADALAPQGAYHRDHLPGHRTWDRDTGDPRGWVPAGAHPPGAAAALAVGRPREGPGPPAVGGQGGARRD